MRINGEAWFSLKSIKISLPFIIFSPNCVEKGVISFLNIPQTISHIIIPYSITNTFGWVILVFLFLLVNNYSFFSTHKRCQDLTIVYSMNRRITIVPCICCSSRFFPMQITHDQWQLTWFLLLNKWAKYLSFHFILSIFIWLKKKQVIEIKHSSINTIKKRGQYSIHFNDSIQSVNDSDQILSFYISYQHDNCLVFCLLCFTWPSS
jgi:hypothetical protein